MIINISKRKSSEVEEKKSDSLIENFNKEAKARKLKYKIEYDNLLYLKKYYSFFENYRQLILYNQEGDYFYFYDGIPEEIFNEIKEIIDKAIPERFDIVIDEVEDE